MAGLLKQYTYSQNLATAGMTVSFSPGFSYELIAILFKTAGAATETATITYDNPAGTTYDTVIGTKTMTTATSMMFQLTAPFIVPEQAALTITTTNATSTVLYVTVMVKEL